MDVAVAAVEEFEEEEATCYLKPRGPRFNRGFAGDAVAVAVAMTTNVTTTTGDAHDSEEEYDSSGEVQVEAATASKDTLPFNNHKGTESINGYSGMEPCGPTRTDCESNPTIGEMVVTLNQFQDDSLSSSYEKPWEDQNIILKPFTNGITEFDVENVLQNQNTHDLFCPNCNSCITKRVILQKRKPDSDIEDATPTPTTIDRHPDVFRCLSCFTFFTSAGNGFKLFRWFGSRNEDEIKESPQQMPEANANMPSILASDTENTVIMEGNDDRQQQEDTHVGALTQSLNFGENLPSSTLESLVVEEVTIDVKAQTDDPMKKSNTGEEDRQHVEAKDPGALKPSLNLNDNLSYQNGSASPIQGDQTALLTSTLEPPVLESVIIDVYRQPDDAVNMSNAVEGGIVVGNVESAEEGTVKPQEDGLKIVVTPAVTSVVFQTTQPKLEQKLDTAVNINSATRIDHKPDSEVENAFAESNVIPYVGRGPVALEVSEGEENVAISAETGIVEQSVTNADEEVDNGVNEAQSLDILKSIVYGGLIETITSLGVVSSAAGADASTLHTFALGLANLFGGLFIIVHGLRDLKNESSTEEEDRYVETLGRRDNIVLHAVVVVLSYIVFGLVAPITYGFSFYQSDEQDYKFAAVAAASLACIILLGLGKAHIQKPPKSYIKTVLYYLFAALMVSGVSYVVGDLVRKLLEKLGLFESTTATMNNIYLAGVGPWDSI